MTIFRRPCAGVIKLIVASDLPVMYTAAWNKQQFDEIYFWAHDRFCFVSVVCGRNGCPHLVHGRLRCITPSCRK